MKLGLMSDTHDDHEMARRGVIALLEGGATTLLHMGDIGSSRVLEELVGHDAHVVFGNCDHDVAGLTSSCEQFAITVHHPAGTLQTPRGELVFTHGHLGSEIDSALTRGAAYLIHGHTHVQADRMHGTTRVINPGALHATDLYTVAILDVERDELSVIEISSSREI